MNLYDIASRLGGLLQSKNLKIVTAESCTGGLLAQVLTSVPGSSNWFQQGWITYSNQSKTSELNVASNLCIEHGAVSQQVVTAMALGALEKSATTANIALATTGVAGPDGGTKLTPVGTVWTAIAFDDLSHLNSVHDIIVGDNIFTEVYHLNGNRNSIREQTVAAILKKLIEFLNHN